MDPANARLGSLPTPRDRRDDGDAHDDDDDEDVDLHKPRADWSIVSDVRVDVDEVLGEEKANDEDDRTPTS